MVVEGRAWPHVAKRPSDAVDANRAVHGMGDKALLRLPSSVERRCIAHTGKECMCKIIFSLPSPTEDVEAHQ